MDDKESLWGYGLGCVGVLLAVVVIVWLTGIHEVNAGEVAVIKSGGNIVGTEDPGFTHCSWPFCSIDYVSTQVQKPQFNEIDAATQEQQEIKITGQINYHIDKAHVTQLYTQVNLSDVEGTLLDRPLQDYVKEATVLYPASEILNHRADIRQHALDAMNAKFSKSYPGLIIDDIFISNMSFSDAYQKAIEDKQVAQQAVQTAQQQQDKAKIDAQTAVIQAQGQADANKALQISLTPEILQQHAIDKWNGILPQFSGSSGVPLINLAPATPKAGG